MKELLLKLNHHAFIPHSYSFLLALVAVARFVVCSTFTLRGKILFEM